MDVQGAKPFIPIVLLLVAANVFSFAQQSNTITFSEESVIKLQDFGRVRLGNYSCSQDGKSYFTMMVDPNLSSDTRLVSVATDGKVTLFDSSGVPDLASYTILSVTADDKGSTALVAGMPNKASPSYSVLQQANTFLLRYDPNGSFVSIRPLSPKFYYHKLAHYGTSLLVVKTDPGSGNLSLGVIDQEGNPIKDVNTVSQFVSKDEGLSYSKQHGPHGIENTSEAFQMALSASSIQLTSVGDAVYLLKSGQTHEAYIIDKDGGIRTLGLRPPEGVDPRGIFPDPSLGLVTIAYGPGERDSSLLRFDTSTGALIGQIQVTGISPVSVMCRKDNKFYGIRINLSGAALLEGDLK